MTFGGQLDKQQRVSSSSALLDNLSATIDVQGEAHFTVATFNNRDIFFSTQLVEVSSTRYQQMQRDGETVRVPINDETLRNFTDNSYTVYHYHRTVSETAIQRQSSAQLLVKSQNLFLTGTLNNDKSRVLIGGKLTGSMKSIHNFDAFGDRVIEEQGTTQFTYTDWVRGNGFLGRKFKRIWQPAVSYQVEVEKSRYPLKLTIEQQGKSNNNPSIQ